MTYVARLDVELRAVRVGRRSRSRILAEARDHLLEAGPGGEERFGDPRALARQFAADCASASSRAAGYWIAAAVAATLVVWAAISVDIRSHPWLNDFPGALVAVLAVQVAFVAMCISLGRTLRYRTGVIPASGLPLVTRANAVAAVSLAVALAATAAAEAGHLALAQAGPWELALSTALLVACVLAAAGSAATTRAAYHAAPVAEPGGAGVADDLSVLGGTALDHLPERVAGPVRRVAASRWLDLRGHPWRFCTTIAAAFLVVISIGGAVQGGDPSPFVGLLEALAIVAGFAVLGRLLGLRR